MLDSAKDTERFVQRVYVWFELISPKLEQMMIFFVAVRHKPALLLTHLKFEWSL